MYECNALYAKRVFITFNEQSPDTDPICITDNFFIIEKILHEIIMQIVQHFAAIKSHSHILDIIFMIYQLIFWNINIQIININKFKTCSKY